MEVKVIIKDALRILWLAVKVVIALFAIFHGTNVSVLYQGF